MRVACGIDLIEIERFQRAYERHGQRLLERLFTPLELSEAAQHLPSLAARFAAKEAVAKALGCGIGPITWHEIEVQRATGGQPAVHLRGEAARLAAALGFEAWALSLSHSQHTAAAVAVALSAAPAAGSVTEA